MADTLRVQLVKLGRAVAAARRARGFSQEDFAEECEVHRNHIGQIERGEVNVSFASLRKVARGARVRLSVLIGQAGL